MPATWWIVGVTVVLVVALLALDWFTAGAKKGRMLVRAQDQQVGNERVDLAIIEKRAQDIRNANAFPL